MQYEEVNRCYNNKYRYTTQQYLQGKGQKLSRLPKLYFPSTINI